MAGEDRSTFEREFPLAQYPELYVPVLVRAVAFVPRYEWDALRRVREWDCADFMSYIATGKVPALGGASAPSSGRRTRRHGGRA